MGAWGIIPANTMYAMYQHHQHRGPSLAIQASQVLYPKATLLTILVAKCLRA